MKRNLTIQLDETTIKEGKIVAARQSMPISSLVSEEISKAAARESTYERIKKSALAGLIKGYDLGGGKVPKHDEIYER